MPRSPGAVLLLCCSSSSSLAAALQCVQRGSTQMGSCFGKKPVSEQNWVALQGVLAWAAAHESSFPSQQSCWVLLGETPSVLHERQVSPMQRQSFSRGPLCTPSRGFPVGVEGAVKGSCQTRPLRLGSLSAGDWRVGRSPA